MKPKQQRAIFIAICMALMAIAATLILRSFRDNLVFFVTPTELQAKLAAGKVKQGQILRLGGLVKNGSIKQIGPGKISFIINDLTNETKVSYKGLLPALFRDGQGAVAEGALHGKQLRASTLLAKHDENYMPPEVARALKKSGHWQGEQPQGTKQ
jgi:cytochrome c-type biogenesis protein CcmE